MESNESTGPSSSCCIAFRMRHLFHSILASITRTGVHKLCWRWTSRLIRKSSRKGPDSCTEQQLALQTPAGQAAGCLELESKGSCFPAWCYIYIYILYVIILYNSTKIMKFGILQWHSEPTARHSVGDDPFQNRQRTQLRTAVHRRHESAKEDYWRCFIVVFTRKQSLVDPWDIFSRKKHTKRSAKTSCTLWQATWEEMCTAVCLVLGREPDCWMHPNWWIFLVIKSQWPVKQRISINGGLLYAGRQLP